MEKIDLDRWDFGKGAEASHEDRGGIRRITVKDALGRKAMIHLLPDQVENFLKLVAKDSGLTLK